MRSLAQVMMTFAPGRDVEEAAEKLAGEREEIDRIAMESSGYIVESINACPSVRCLVYTSSIAAMMDASAEFYESNPVVDESRHPGTETLGAGAYNCVKDRTEIFFADAAAASGGRWSSVSANPADIIGPILSPHQALETWQGKIGGMIQGIAAEQEHACVGEFRRPWITVDVRDCAEAHVRMFERLGDTVHSGDRYLLSDMSRIHPEDIGARLNDLFADYDCADTVGPDSNGGDSIEPIHPMWDRVQARNDKARAALDFEFTYLDATLKDTVESLVEIGGVEPRMRGLGARIGSALGGGASVISRSRALGRDA